MKPDSTQGCGTPRPQRSRSHGCHSHGWWALCRANHLGDCGEGHGPHVGTPRSAGRVEPSGRPASEHTTHHTTQHTTHHTTHHTTQHTTQHTTHHTTCCQVCARLRETGGRGCVCLGSWIHTSPFHTRPVTSCTGGSRAWRRSYSTTRQQVTGRLHTHGSNKMLHCVQICAPDPWVRARCRCRWRWWHRLRRGRAETGPTAVDHRR